MPDSNTPTVTRDVTPSRDLHDDALLASFGEGDGLTIFAGLLIMLTLGLMVLSTRFTPPHIPVEYEQNARTIAEHALNVPDVTVQDSSRPRMSGEFLELTVQPVGTSYENMAPVAAMGTVLEQARTVDEDSIVTQVVPVDGSLAPACNNVECEETLVFVTESGRYIGRITTNRPSREDVTTVTVLFHPALPGQ